MALENLVDLEAEWGAFMEDRPGARSKWTLDQKWRADNPGKLQGLVDYRGGGPRPAPTAEDATHRRMLHHLDAYTKAKGSTPPPQSGTVPAVEVKITPNWIHPTSGSTNHNAVHNYGQSPATPYRSPDSLKQVARYLLLDPRYKCADGHQGSDEWWFIIERYWPADYPASNHGRWGREVNYHNVAGDAGPNGGVGWGFGEGTSSLAIDWLPSRSSPQFTVQPMQTAGDPRGHEHSLPVPVRDEWQTYVAHYVAGRREAGLTLRPGSLRVWANGALVIDIQNADTVQRAKASDGVYYVQRWMQLWEGDYTMDIQVAARTRLALTRVGRSYSEALADRPTKKGDNVPGQFYRGTGIDLGPPSATALPNRDVALSRLPSGLQSHRSFRSHLSRLRLVEEHVSSLPDDPRQIELIEAHRVLMGLHRDVPLRLADASH